MATVPDRNGGAGAGPLGDHLKSKEQLRRDRMALLAVVVVFLFLIGLAILAMSFAPEAGRDLQLPILP
jgi:hypothetical protein